MKRMPLLLTLLALVALSASIAYWVLQLYKPEQRPLAAVPVAAMPEPAVDAAATLFGGQAMAAVASNYQLTGVVAAGRDSVAILVADGQPAKAFPVGKELAAGVVVKEVHPRYVMLSEGGVLKRIDIAVDVKPPADMAAPMQMQMQAEPPAPPAYPQQEQPAPPAYPQQGVPARPLPQSQPVPQPQQEQQQEPPQGPEEPPAPVPMARPVDGVTAPPPPAPVQMPPATRNIGAPGPAPVAQ